MRNFLYVVAALAGAVFYQSPVMGQGHDHSDIEFGYNSLAAPTAIEIEGSAFTVDGFAYWESDVDVFGAELFAENPGYTTNPDEGLLVGQGDRIFVSVLNANMHSVYGVGYINYYNPATNQLEAYETHQISVGHNDPNPGNWTDLVFNGINIVSGDNPLFLGTGSNTGEMHDHLIFNFFEDAPIGAYGVLFQLEAYFAANASNQPNLVSDAYWVIWNHGMSHEDFESLALPAFGAIPEPGSALLLGLGSLGWLIRRRR